MYEWKSRGFRAPEQYRSVEFARDWNLTNTTLKKEHFVNTYIDVKKDDKGFQTGIGWNYFNQAGVLTGQQQVMKLSFQKDNWDIRSEVNWMQSKDSLYTSSFLRPNIHVEKSFDKLK